MPEANLNASKVPEFLPNDRRLVAGILLPLFAAGFNTIVGYTVAHWVVIVAYKRMGYLVSVCDLAICGLAAFLSWSVLRQASPADDTQPERGRQLFMAKMGLCLSAFGTVVIIAGTLVMLTLSPSD
jgi:hypothetical protein